MATTREPIDWNYVETKLREKPVTELAKTLAYWNAILAKPNTGLWDQEDAKRCVDLISKILHD
jgi:hypothetical protein